MLTDPPLWVLTGLNMSSRTGAFKNKGSGLDNHKIWIRIRSLGQPNGWRSTNTWLEVWDVVSNVPKPTQSQGKWTKDYILRKKNLWKQWNRYKWLTWYKFKIMVIKMVTEVRKAMARTKRISKRWQITTIKWIISKKASKY